MEVNEQKAQDWKFVQEKKQDFSLICHLEATPVLLGLIQHRQTSSRKLENVMFLLHGWHPFEYFNVFIYLSLK